MSTVTSHTAIPSAADIKSAAIRIAPYISRTPVLKSPMFNNLAGGDFYLKCEHLQMTGAFKARGAMNTVLVHREEALKNGLLTHSSGNHGAALSWAAAQIGAKAYVIMPSNAPKAKIASVKYYGGIVTFCESTLEARETTAEQVRQDTGALLIHPYDNYDIIAGQATATYELLQEHPDLSQIFVPVGGGGLLAGAALANSYFGKAKVIGCEPSIADDAFKSFTSGKWIPAKSTNTIADGLKTSLGHKNFPIIHKHVERITLLTEDEIQEGWHTCLETIKQLIEPSAGTGVAAAMREETNGKTGIILCGGNMDVRRFTLL
ncbi:MAG TPA: serine dehydratase [Cryomorphaceae bacterium]|nr:serine dehydratase [Cryomorphaceae bacterium]|tara:strand:- start:2618 stop:3574 length:957 start_codon:yes stop_codon:yes gene_type:complete